MNPDLEYFDFISVKKKHEEAGWSNAQCSVGERLISDRTKSHRDRRDECGACVIKGCL